MVSQDTPSLRSIGDILVRWMRENNTTDWTTGIRLQFQKNRQDHVGIKHSPYETMFGCAPKVGLSTTPILNEILQVLQKEEDLQAHLNDKPSDKTPDNANSNVNSVEDNNLNDTNNISWEIDMGYKFNIFEKPIQAVHFSWFVRNRSRFEH